MTIFLALSALVNIGLGYGLAIYLGHARSPFRSTDEPAVDLFAAPVGEHASQPMEALAPSPPVSAPAAQVAPPSAPAEPAVATTPTAESAELETDVLAGIEEFRNQLAQMKAQPAGAESAAPQPALAAAGA